MNDHMGRKRLQLSDNLARGLGWRKGTAVSLEQIIARVKEFTREPPEHLEGNEMVSRGWQTCSECGGAGCKPPNACWGGQSKFEDRRRI